MKVHVVQHVDFEGPGGICTWADELGHELVVLHPLKGDKIPAPYETDLLILLGGLFEIENSDLEWLVKERLALNAHLEAGTKIFAICGGAQLIASLLGAEITLCESAEIGWHPIRLFDSAVKIPSARQRLVFHWHRVQFSLPPGAERIASSQSTSVQGFRFGANLMAVQFHPEITSELIESYGAALSWPEAGAESVQTREVILESTSRGISDSRDLLKTLLADLLGKV